ncbi:carboxymuconolactone decarboxylase family protein [Terriglobus sp. TAA 43]|uniref:carboxymuconolactone decarboxylase family protein n=1 Tax=Terriglobus sp. TAA 43 TaxID=278961 RepID=UPI000648F48B|nr:carboxymuconolactone decarboxylase family protein [Terriglobus sp. TAA 43]
MSLRIDYAHQSPELFRKYLEMSMALKKSSIDEKLKSLVEIRASQLNGCAFCLDMHVKQAKIAGERELRLYHVSIWRESNLFTPKERAALEWTEAVTKLGEHGVSDAIFDSVRKELSEKELTDLTFVLMVINGWNRVSVAFQAVPGSQDEAYGLTAAGLS